MRIVTWGIVFSLVVALAAGGVAAGCAGDDESNDAGTPGSVRPEEERPIGATSTSPTPPPALAPAPPSTAPPDVAEPESPEVAPEPPEVAPTQPPEGDPGGPDEGG